MKRVTVSTNGRVTLPKAVRDRKRWPAGTQPTIEEKGNGVLLKPVESNRTRKLSDLVGFIKYEGPTRSVEEMNGAIEKELSRRWTARVG